MLRIEVRLNWNLQDSKIDILFFPKVFNGYFCPSPSAPPEIVACFMNHLRASLHLVVRQSASPRRTISQQLRPPTAISSSQFCQKSTYPFSFLVAGASATSPKCKRCISHSAVRSALPNNWGQTKTHRKVKVNVNWGTMTADQEIKLAPLRQSVKEQVSGFRAEQRLEYKV